MMNPQLNIRWSVVTAIVFAVAFSRLLPHTIAAGLFNFSPIGGIALFGAAYFNKKYLAYVLPLVALWLTNLLIDNIFYSSYYNGFAWFANYEVYFAFLLIVMLGTFLLRKVSVTRLGIGAISSSMIFFLVTNFYVWLNSGMYPRTFDGLVGCYIAAIPFYWNSLYSDLFYVALLFGAFELVKYRYPKLLLEKA